MSGAQLAAAAEALLGVQFRLHGRDPATGLDCLGLVLAALRTTGRPAKVAVEYGLRNLDPQRFAGIPARIGFTAVEAPPAAGDLLAFAPGPAQLHLGLVARCDGLVHAHAGLGRVVITPFPTPWPALGQWRLS